MSLFKKIKSTGIRYSFAILFNRIVPAWLFRCRRFTVYQMDPNSVDTTDSDSNIRVNWCQSELEIEAVEKLTYFNREYSGGEPNACQALVDGELAGAFWANTGLFDESELGIQIVLEPEQVWLYAALVDINHRRKGVYSKILQFILPALEERGLTQQLVSVNPHNLGSNHVHKRHSKKTPGTVLAIRFLKSSVCFASGEIKSDRRFSMNSTKHPIKLFVKT